MRASDVAELMVESCSEVLESMYFTSVLGPAEQAPPAGPADDFAASLTFTGDISGRFGVRLGGASAQTLAANFLGEEESELSPREVGEVVGELANMFCGSVVSHIKGERNFVLSHPELTTSVPAATEEDLFMEALDTDCGVITIWVSVDRSATGQ